MYQFLYGASECACVFVIIVTSRDFHYEISSSRFNAFSLWEQCVRVCVSAAVLHQKVFIQMRIDECGVSAFWKPIENKPPASIDRLDTYRYIESEGEMKPKENIIPEWNFCGSVSKHV